MHSVTRPFSELTVFWQPPMKAETYIHRSGRTGRAGKTGVCVTFYTVKQQWGVTNIERHAGLKFERLGVPQPGDLIRASATEITSTLDKVRTHPTFSTAHCSTADSIPCRRSIPRCCRTSKRWRGH